ncbi:uncharacterized protein LOC108209271 isoform X2 [Daucus carota subsp. sativus]
MLKETAEDEAAVNFLLDEILLLDEPTSAFGSDINSIHRGCFSEAEDKSRNDYYYSFSQHQTDPESCGCQMEWTTLEMKGIPQIRGTCSPLAIWSKSVPLLKIPCFLRILTMFILMVGRKQKQDH